MSLQNNAQQLGPSRVVLCGDIWTEIGMGIGQSRQREDRCVGGTGCFVRGIAGASGQGRCERPGRVPICQTQILAKTSLPNEPLKFTLTAFSILG